MVRANASRHDVPFVEMVERLDDATLRQLLVRAASLHDDVARDVRLAAALPAGRVAALRVAVDDALRTRRFLDYRDSIEWAAEGRAVVEALAEEAVSTPSRGLLELVERAAAHVVKVILHADDSSGDIGDLARLLLDVHQQLCAAGVADPRKLAQWMIRFSLEDQDFFHVDPVMYAAALGDDGLAMLRAAVDAHPAAGSGRYARAHLQERLAIIDGDVDRVVALFGGDLSNSFHYQKLAGAMLELGRPDDALQWAMRGIDVAKSWTSAPLYDLVAGILAERSDFDALLALRRDQHRRAPVAATYRLLAAAADACNVWPSEREWARAALLEGDRGGLVDVLLEDGDVDLAWSAATGGGQWYAGDERWARLAAAREATNPAAALGVYLRLVESTLTKADSRAYRVAIRQLKDARRAATAAELSATLDEYVTDLRERHRRRPTLVEMLDKAGFR